jgi:hypothetical protein
MGSDKLAEVAVANGTRIVSRAAADDSNALLHFFLARSPALVWLWASKPSPGASSTVPPTPNPPASPRWNPASQAPPTTPHPLAPWRFTRYLPPPGTPFVVEYSKCSAVSGNTMGWMACAAIAASLNPCKISFSFPG